MNEMTLLELRKHFESFDDGHVFEYSLSKPFSWRGIYAEVCFSINNYTSTREENLLKINEAYTGIFIGWKGGEFKYNDSTQVNFEATKRDYSDGGYAKMKLEEMNSSFDDLENKLVKTAFV